MEDGFGQRKSPFGTEGLREDECPIIIYEPEMKELKKRISKETLTEINKISEDEYLIIVYESNIELPEKRVLKEMIQGSNPIIFFSDAKKLALFVYLFHRSFDLICPIEGNDGGISKAFQSLGYEHNRRLLYCEEKSFLQHVFRGISYPLRKSLKVISFFTESDLTQ